MKHSFTKNIKFYSRFIFFLGFLMSGYLGMGQFGEPQIITTNADHALSVYASDLDGDGDMDILSASYLDNKIAWYENDGTGNTGPQQVITTQADGANSVYAIDLDGDGDMDVLSASSGDDKIAWYENDGLGNFGPQQLITTNANFAQSVYATDLDGDGDMDVLSASYMDNKIAWYENDGLGNFGDQQIITTLANGSYSVYASDLDGDGDIDVLSVGGNIIAWYENDGVGNFGNQQIITSFVIEAKSIYTSDVDSDGDLDVLSASSYDNKIAWYENDGNGNFGSQQIITTSAIGAMSVFATDLDGDGDMDVLSVSSTVNDSQIAWYENLSNQGCTDPTACNYNSFFVVDDGSCCYDNCGCTNEEASNYDSSASCDDNSCIILGCIDNTACNFGFYANEDDGSCTYPGCNDELAYNYDSTAGCDDQSCIYEGCIDELACNFDSNASIDDGSCTYFEITISDDIVVCAGDTVTLTVSGGETYNWNGLGEEPTLEVTPVETTTYEVSAINEYNCSDTDSITVLVNPLPTVELSEDITLCQGESTTLTASGGETYDWNGLGTESTLEVTPSETTTYEVEVTNEYDCTNTAEVTVFINPLPTAEITADLVTLTAIAAETYQWYLNGNPIDGANAQTYVAQENGNYSVAVTNEFGCTSLSEEIIISVVGLDELVNENIQLFPNPMQESSILYFGESGTKYQVKLYTAEGKLIQNFGIVTNGQLEIQRKGLSSGSYLVEVMDVENKSTSVIKLMVE